MTKENYKEKLSRLFDGDLGEDIPGEINRESWEIYSVIGDSLRDGPHHLSRDISAEVRRRLENIAANESNKKRFWTALSGSSLFGYLRSFCQFPTSIWNHF